MKANLKNLQKELAKVANPKKAKILQSFFKTGKGEYGEGDIFLGIQVPTQRTIAGKYIEVPLTDLKRLLASKVHEHRFTATLILVEKFQKGDPKLKQQIARFYLKNKKFINNWDLVDTSASYILGPIFFKQNKAVIYKLAQSKNIWDRRIAILTTFYFIKQGQFQDSLTLAKKLLNDKHDLIQKALGWMLREIGKKNETVLLMFLNQNYKKMPRTMLRYSIERLPRSLQLLYLRKG